MILLEEYLELRIYHHNELRTYDVLEIFTDDEGVIFKILYAGEYLFTLVPVKTSSLTFQLSKMDKDIDIEIDWELYLKIEASLYSIFLNEEPS
jgi:hypothetical protein